MDVHGRGRTEHDYEHLRNVLQVLIQSRSRGRMIRYSSQSQAGKLFPSQDAHVLRLEYSIENDLFYAILYPKGIKRPVKSWCI